jgi:hypothetical protein
MERFSTNRPQQKASWDLWRVQQAVRIKNTPQTRPRLGTQTNQPVLRVQPGPLKRVG